VAGQAVTNEWTNSLSHRFIDRSADRKVGCCHQFAVASDGEGRYRRRVYSVSSENGQLLGRGKTGDVTVTSFTHGRSCVFTRFDAHNFGNASAHASLFWHEPKFAYQKRRKHPPLLKPDPDVPLTPYVPVAIPEGFEAIIRWCRHALKPPATTLKRLAVIANPSQVGGSGK